MLKTNHPIVYFFRRLESDIRNFLFTRSYFRGYFGNGAKNYFKKYYDERNLYMAQSTHHPQQYGKHYRKPIYLPLTPDVRKRWGLCNQKIGARVRMYQEDVDSEFANRICKKFMNDLWWEENIKGELG